MSIQEMQELANEGVNKLVSQVRALVDKAHVENLNLHLIVLGITGQGQMVTISTAGLPDPLTRARLLGQAAIAEVEATQQALQRAAQAETVRLVQKSTEAMTKN
jgi:hypothetical protein